MKKSLLTGLLAIAAISVNAQDDVTTYNFFDPEDCDAEGWLWLDTPEKIAKYIGADKKIQLIDAQYEIDDPEFPGSMIYPETVADPTVEGYNNQGVKGGEGSKTGGIIMPAAGSEYRQYGGGILVQMPDCASFDVYVSQEKPIVMLNLDGAWEYADPAGCKYIHVDAPAFWSWEEDDFAITDYAGYDLDLQLYTYDWTNLENQDPALETFSIFGEEGNPRTAYLSNSTTECPTILQGIRIKTFTDVSLAETSVEGVVADAEITINGKVVSLSAPAEISVYTAAGVKVAGVYGTSLDCSALNGLYIVKAGNKAVKVNL